MNHGVRKIISGGQTGADRAGIDAAIDLEIDYGGSIPKGKRTEDGTLPERYNQIAELETTSYAARTEKNVVDSDATVIFTYTDMGDGSAFTLELARKHNKPHLHINIENKRNGDAIKDVSEWLDKVKPAVLNVAGSRESGAKGIYDRVYGILKAVLLKCQ